MNQTQTTLKCTFECGRPARSKGMCHVCYEYARRRQSGKRVMALEVLELKAAIRAISNVLGTGTCTQPNCDGCHYEMKEAADIARQALSKDSHDR